MITLPAELMSRYIGQPDGGFALLANVEAIDAPVDIISGLTLRQAEPHEAAVLRELVKHVPSPSQPMPRRNPYETRLIIESAGDTAKTFRSEQLDERDFKYVVAAFSGTNSHVYEFVERSALTAFELELGPEVLHRSLGGFMCGWGPSVGQFLDALQSDETLLLRLDQHAIAELREVFTRYEAHDSRVGLGSAVAQYHQLKSLAPASPLSFLGYVAIIESLITHAPDPKDPYDSLTRQVRQKMLLLSRRFSIKLGYDQYFSSAKPETVWNKLYAYRSAIAHGVKPDFAKTLKVLKGPSQALGFIRAATRSVMRHAPDEPELVADLHEC